MKRYYTFLIVMCPLLLHGQVKNLDRLPQYERDSILVAAAKQIILKYGPDFYDEHEPLVVTRRVVTKEEENNGGTARGAYEGRVQYNVGYFKPNHKELLERFPNVTPFSVQIQIWEDTGLVGGMSFGGNGVSYKQEIDPNAEPDPEHDIFVRAKPGEKRFMPKSEYDQWKKDRDRK